MSTIHNFTDSLRASHAAANLPIWEEIYRKAFRDFAGMIDHRQDGEHQRAGIDRSVILANSKQILIDEKFRDRNKKTGKVYPDILLEYLSDADANVPGWVCKTLRCDYIAYAIGPLGKCYLLPVVQLQAAWRRYGDAWIEEYHPRTAPNNGWRTLSTPVPVAVLYKAIGEFLRIDFKPYGEAEQRALFRDLDGGRLGELTDDEESHP